MACGEESKSCVLFFRGVAKGYESEVLNALSLPELLAATAQPTRRGCPCTNSLALDLLCRQRLLHSTAVRAQCTVTPAS